ncbi:MAG: prolipoprotein diacylglyceryl transferase, partial [Bacteroidia bacterium]|nr:prolipoprotein diacylglyceryl transferase [Bacteroidia bacterium]
MQKVGCFINGCCFGKPSELIWAVQYPRGSQVHYSQWSSHLINQDEAFSMFVHPVQLYETFGLLLLGYIIWRTRNYWKKNLSPIFFSMVMFLIFRFLIEFIRDPASSQFEVTYIYGIKNLQWIIFIISCVLALLLFIYENYLKLDKIKVSEYNYTLKVDLLYILVLSTCIYIFSNLLTRYEILSVWIKFIPAILITLYYILKKIEYRTYRVTLSFVLIIPLFVFAQTYENDSLSTKKFKQIDIGGSFGKFYNELRYNPQTQTSDCGSSTTYDYDYLKNKYSIGGLGFSQVTRKGFKENKLGVNLHGGNIKTTGISSNVEESNFVYGINPYYKYEGKWVGIGAGFQIGNLILRKDIEDVIESSELSDKTKKHNFFPEFYLRFGRRDWFDIDYNYGFLMPSAFPTVYS